MKHHPQQLHEQLLGMVLRTKHGIVLWLYSHNTIPCIRANPIDVLLHIDPLYHAVTHSRIASTRPACVMLSPSYALSGEVSLVHAECVG